MLDTQMGGFLNCSELSYWFKWMSLEIKTDNI